MITRLGLLDPGLVVADGRAGNQASVFEHSGHFDKRDVELTEKSVLDELGHMAQVDVHVLHFAGVDALAGLRIRLVGKPQMNAAGHGERAVELRAGGGAGEDADLEFLSAQVGVGDAASQRQGHGLGIAGAGEAAHADLMTMLDQRGRLLGAHDAIGETGVEDTRGGGNDGR